MNFAKPCRSEGKIEEIEKDEREGNWAENGREIGSPKDDRSLENEAPHQEVHNVRAKVPPHHTLSSNELIPVQAMTSANLTVPKRTKINDKDECRFSENWSNDNTQGTVVKEKKDASDLYFDRLDVDDDLCEKTPSKYSPFIILSNGLISNFEGRILVPESLRETVLKRYHNYQLAGHQGVTRT